MQSIELLAPARNLECGIEAIRHGADAVYIGAPRFGARAAAGNSLEDIAALVRYAHAFGVRIYVTVNTLFYVHELPAVQALIDALAAIHVDAIITQDPRIVPYPTPPSASTSAPGLVYSSIPLHSSTQMDNRTAEDVRARLSAGYQQTVLARELTLDEIRAIHAAVPEMPLEAFVHGALCVSYSGRCYASEYCFGRSANRGECAQFCRLPFDLIDADGHLLSDPENGRPLRQRHLLSLRDMNRSAYLEAMMDAGISSFKIEGRLKDVTYVKNTTAYYRRLIDGILARRSEDVQRSEGSPRPEPLRRASFGQSTFSFTPNVQKSFNRRFTDYFLHGRTADLACFATPKAIGEPVGQVKDVVVSGGSSAYLSVAGTASFANGDGLCFFDDDDRLQGFRINRVDQYGRLTPANPAILSLLHKGQALYRNYDAAFERLLARPSADRRMAVRWLLEDTPDGFCLSLTTEDGRSATATFPYPHEAARTPQSDNIRRQLSRLGDSPFIVNDANHDICLRLSDNWFIPSSVLTAWRRQVQDNCPDTPGSAQTERGKADSKLSAQPHLSAVAYDERTVHQPYSEAQEDTAAQPLMTCRYCLRYALGSCPRQPHHHALPQHLALRLADGRTFSLRFDCKRCEMHVLRP